MRIRYVGAGMFWIFFVLALIVRSSFCRPFTARSGNRAKMLLIRGSRTSRWNFLPFLVTITADRPNRPTVTTELAGSCR